MKGDVTISTVHKPIAGSQWFKRVSLFLCLLVVATTSEMTAGNPVSTAATLSSSHKKDFPWESETLAQARAGFVTHLTYNANCGCAVPTPPRGVLDVVEYPSSVGPLAAYLTPDPGDGRKHPAIIWITGGDDNSIGDVWTPEPANNDQSAAQYRQAGIVMMYPSLRGGNTNPGRKEGFLGECNDVLAAARFLAAQPYVDPNRIFLGGHSTGGTLALLVAELPNPFRAVFAFGPVVNPVSYGDPSFTPFNTKNAEEVLLRSPGLWLTSVQTPTWIIEGARSPSNIWDLRWMERAPHNSLVHFIALANYDHFSDLRPTNTKLATSIVVDSGTGTFRVHLG